MAIICPKCEYQRSDNDDPAIPESICPSCSIVYAKYNPNKVAVISDAEKIDKIKQRALLEKIQSAKKTKRTKVWNGIKYILLKLFFAYLILMAIAFTLVEGGLFLLIWLAIFYFIYRWYKGLNKKDDLIDNEDRYSLQVTTRVMDSKKRRGSSLGAGRAISIDPVSVEIDYIDGSYEKSNRSIDIDEIQLTKYRDYFSGYCYLRNDERQFRADRVIKCIDLETGEVTDDMSEFLKGLVENQKHIKYKQ